MSKITFLILFIILLLGLLLKDKIILKLKMNNIVIHSKAFDILFVVLMILLIVFGMLYMENTKQRFGEISTNVEKMRKPSDTDKPHRYFDINTYPDTF